MTNWIPQSFTLRTLRSSPRSKPKMTSWPANWPQEPARATFAEFSGRGGGQDQSVGLDGRIRRGTGEITQCRHPAHGVPDQGERPGDPACGEHLCEVIGELLDAIPAHRRLTRSAVPAVVVANDPDGAAVSSQQVIGLAHRRRLAQTKPVQENNGLTGVSRAAVAHGKSHTVAHRHINVVLAPAALDGAATSWPMIADGCGLVIQSGGSAARPPYLIAGRGHGITGSVAGEVGMDIGRIQGNPGAADGLADGIAAHQGSAVMLRALADCPWRRQGSSGSSDDPSE